MDERTIKVQALREDFPFYAGQCLWIQTKEGRLQPLVLNEAQRYIHQRLQEQLSLKGMIRAIILKGRQQGASTYTEGRFFHRTTLNEGMRAYILTHRDEATNHLFNMAKRYYDLCPEFLKPPTRKSNTKELEFEQMMSEYKVATAGGKGAGRSGTVQLLHGSELAFWPNAEGHLAGLGQTVPQVAGTEVILESTANGVGNTPSVWRDLDGWIRHSLRCVQWRQWNVYRRRKTELIRLGVPPDLARTTAWSANGPWRISHTPGVRRALTNWYFDALGLPRLNQCVNI